MLFADILIVQIKHRFTLLILVGVLLIWWAILPFKYYDELVKRIYFVVISKKSKVVCSHNVFCTGYKKWPSCFRGSIREPLSESGVKVCGQEKKGRRLTLVPLWHYFYNLSAWNGLKRYEQMLVSSGRFRIKFILLLYMSFPEDWLFLFNLRVPDFLS